MLLVPLLLLGCMSKGVSDAVEDTTTSNLGGYTWTQLQSMVNISDENGDIHSSIIGNMAYISNLKTSSYVTSDEIIIINKLLSKMQDVYEAIRDEDSSFMYSTYLSSVQTYDDSLISSYKILSLEDLKRLKTELAVVLAANSTDSTLTSIYDNVALATKNLPVYRANNPFYAMNAD